jgi:hypothetical protein
MPFFFGDTAIGLQLICSLQTFARRLIGELRQDAGGGLPKEALAAWLDGYGFRLTPEKTLRPKGLTLNPSTLALSG